MILVGQAPAKSSEGILMGRAGARLARLMGIPEGEYAARFRRMNLLPEWPGKSGKGDAFDLPAARSVVAQLAPSWQGSRLVLLGGAVCAALGHRGGLFEWAPDTRGFLACRVPHPSGISRWWNDPSNARRASDFFRALARG